MCMHGSGLQSETSNADCTTEDGTKEGSVRLRGGFGTPCDPLHTEFIEVLTEREWGGISTSVVAETQEEDTLVADVVCRQLGFPHGTRVNPLTSDPEIGSFRAFPEDVSLEAEAPVERFWLSSVTCRGSEGSLLDCDLGPGFRVRNEGCPSPAHPIYIACRQFSIVEALEAVTSPGAGTTVMKSECTTMYGRRSSSCGSYDT